MRSVDSSQRYAARKAPPQGSQAQYISFRRTEPAVVNSEGKRTRKGLNPVDQLVDGSGMRSEALA